MVYQCCYDTEVVLGVFSSLKAAEQLVKQIRSRDVSHEFYSISQRDLDIKSVCLLDYAPEDDGDYECEDGLLNEN